MNFDVNVFSVIISAVVFMVVGSLWYGPLFGKKWMQLVNMTPESMKSMPKNSVMVSMIYAFIVALVTSFVLAAIIKSLLITTVGAGLMVAFFVWLGFVATTLLNRVLFERSSVSLYLLNISQSLVALLLASLVIVLWPW